MSARTLRSRSKSLVKEAEESDKPEEIVVQLSAPTLSEPSEAKKGRKRRRSQDYVEPKIYNPKYFTKGSGYEGIVDSSDSDSEYDEEPDENAKDPDEFEPQSTSVSDSSGGDASGESGSDEESGEEGSEESGEEGSEEGNDDSGEALSIELDEDGHEAGVDTDYNYFALDKDPLTIFLTRKIKAKFPNATEDVIKDAIASALGGARDELVDEYTGASPKDQSWKVDVPEEEVPALEEQLKQLRQNIKDRAPTIPKILRSGLSMAEKERALQLYDALKNLEPYTLPYIDVSTKITDILAAAPAEFNAETNAKVDELRAKMKAKNPSVEAIVNAKLTQADKLRALQLYEAFQQLAPYTSEWFAHQRQINHIVNSALPSDEEVARLEAAEDTAKKATLSFTTDLKTKIFELDADPEIKSRLYELYGEMLIRDPSDSQHAELKSKLIWALRLPYRKMSVVHVPRTAEEIQAVCSAAYQYLDANIYGMKEVKMRVIQALNNRLYNPKSRTLMALKGKPGVGKTRVAKIIARAIGRPFERINLGGSVDSSIFKGSNNVWVGSAPSLLLQLLCRTKVSDPVLSLDEIDKLGISDKGIEIQHALLHVLDPMQNSEFQDSFLNEYSHDISHVWFIPLMNDDTKLSPELRDRLDIIEVEPYSNDDMVQIVKRHTLPEALTDAGIDSKAVTITTGGAQRIITRLGDLVRDTGMRPIEKVICSIVSRLSLLRTLYAGSADSSAIPVDFNLSDFKGFPYELTENSIDVLFVPPKNKVITYIM